MTCIITIHVININFISWLLIITLSKNNAYFSEYVIMSTNITRYSPLENSCIASICVIMSTRAFGFPKKT